MLHLKRVGSFHVLKEPEALLFVFHEGVPLTVRPQIHARAQILHRLQMLDPQKIDGLQKEAPRECGESASWRFPDLRLFARDIRRKFQIALR